MEFFKDLSLINLILITFALSVIFMWLGLLIGRQHLKKKKDPEKGYGSIITSQLTIVAFMIAFIFGMASSRFEKRRSVILDQANSIGTTYLRTDLLPEPQRTEMKRLLRDYVNEYAGVYEKRIKLEDGIARTDVLLDKMWDISSQYAGSQTSNVAIGIYIQSLNETIDFHTKQLSVSVYQKIPDEVWLTLYLLAAMSMFATGFYAGVSGGTFGIPGILLAFTFTLMISTISDLDRGSEGIFRIKNRPFFELQKKINSEVE
ncbi:MAG: hypothetical protein K1X85_04550 [Ignavibacteria bacterium]|nr:hypothetical protein [Ignavibacteria bacterium]